MKLSVFYHHVLEAAKQENCTVDAVLSKIREFGITAVEVDRDAVAEPEELSKVLMRHEFTVSSMYGFYDFAQGCDPEKCRRHIALARAVGAGKIMVVPGFYTKPEAAERETELKRMLEGTAYLTRLAGESGIRTTIEDFDDRTSPLHTISGVRKFLREIPALGMTFDTGNFILSGEDELEALDLLQDRIVHVHCKDRAYDDNRNICPSPVGYGFLKMKEMIERLKVSHYDGFLAIEHFDAPNYLDFIQKSADWLNRNKEG